MAKLYIVPTPIGNLDDITIRAVRVLSEVDFILAEDTRTSSVLLKHLGIEKKMYAHHKFNEHATVGLVADNIAQGRSAALISDAGTPGISDPGSCWCGPVLKRGSRWRRCPELRLSFRRSCRAAFRATGFASRVFCPRRKAATSICRALRRSRVR